MKPKIAVKHILMFILCGSLIFSLVPQVKTVIELTEYKAGLMEKKTELQERNTSLLAQLDSAVSIENIERLAREKLGMVRRGEKLLVTIPDNRQ